MGVQVALDFFPARVELPDGTALRPTRVFVADGEVQVWISIGGRPQLYWSTRYVDSTGSRVAGYKLNTDDGVVLARRDSDCGCGNSLKRFNPWPGQRRMLVKL